MSHFLSLLRIYRPLTMWNTFSFGRITSSHSSRNFFVMIQIQVIIFSFFLSFLKNIVEILFVYFVVYIGLEKDRI